AVSFFFQAEDGIRDFHVTGVQTCALPISRVAVLREFTRLGATSEADKAAAKQSYFSILQLAPTDVTALSELEGIALEEKDRQLRSEERRVGKECTSRRWAGQRRETRPERR